MSFFLKIKNNLVIIIILVFFLYVVLVFFADVEKFSNILMKINFETIALTLFLMSISIFLLAIRFHRLVKSLNISLTLKQNVSIYFAGLGFGLTPGNIGTVIKSQFIKNETGEPISKTFPIILVEKWNELNSVLIILLITFTIPSIFEVKIISIVGIILSVGFFGILRIKLIFLFFKKLTNKIIFLNKLEYGIENSYDSFRILTNFRNSIEGIVITTVAKIFEVFAIVVLLNQIGIDLGYLVSAQIYFTGVLFGFLSFIPGGLIVTEGSMLTLFTKFTNDLALSATAVILVRLFTLWLATFVGIVFSKFFIKKIKF